MCFHTAVLCAFCGSQVGRHIQTTCYPQFQQSPRHQVFELPPSIIRPPTPYACPNRRCIANTELHWALRDQQEVAMQQGKANLDYVPFHEIKARSNDTDDEACNFALESYPPQYVRGARVRPEWLSGKKWLKVLELRSRGKNILEIAQVVDKNASLLRAYVDTYLKDVSIQDLAQLPSASSVSSTDSSRSTAGSTGSDYALFPLGDEVMVPQEGMPDPSFLTRREQELVWRMFQQNATVRSMFEKVHKSRRKLSQYINAYLRPRLLRLQAEERQAEDRMAGPSTYIASLTNVIPSNLTSKPGHIAAAEVPPARLFLQPGPHSIDDACLDLELVETPPAVPDEDPKTSSGPAPLVTPKGASNEGSLFGDSPVDENHVVCSPTQLISTHDKDELAQPISRKRKADDGEAQVEPRRASKRLRHRSFP